MNTINPHGFYGEIATSDLFGGNVLANRGNATGEGSYEQLAEEIGVSSLRYPGGSLTEEYFDLSNPDSPQQVGNETGEIVDFIPISDFLEMASSVKASVSIVIPTRNMLSNAVDENGDRIVDINEEGLRDFVYDVVTGVYGEADILMFEIGNEYWGSGRMNSAEYGRVAKEVTEIIADELAFVEETTGIDTEEIRIGVQMGANFNYASLSVQYDGMSPQGVILDMNEKYNLGIDDSIIRGNGEVNWFELSNKIIIGEIGSETIELIDGIIAHVYSKEPEVEGQRDFLLDVINDTWVDSFPDMEIYVTEWNQHANTGAFDEHEDYGLYQAQEMLNIVEEFMASGVDSAYVWPLIQNTESTLSQGFSHTELTVAGEMFAIMQETLPGKQMIDLDMRSDETEAVFEGLSVHAFYGNGEVVFYLMSDSPTTGTFDVYAGGIFNGYEDVFGKILGVGIGEDPGSNSSNAIVQEINTDGVIDGLTISAELNPGEILVLTFSRVELSNELEHELIELGGSIDVVEDPLGEIFDDEPVTDQFIKGTVLADTILGANGNDTISSGLNNDTVYGGLGDDSIGAGAGHDFVKSGDGNDFVKGGVGNDTLNAGAGNDAIKGDFGSDIIRGREGDDWIDAGFGDDEIYGESDNDTLKGGEGSDTIFGGWGEDILLGNDGDDFMDGGAGRNTLSGGAGEDTFFFDLEDSFENSVVDFDPSADKLELNSDNQDDFEISVHEGENGEVVVNFDDDQSISFQNHIYDEDNSASDVFAWLGL
ncbi:Hemolysin-type calcium-binding repeat-containing protein [Roseivivax lentus]|uniref:Hemolysin-type calcium-binding repeat-containing protein n=1 Tax=Roseivivax lentus TaxID=633194 RepID=A0A1N7Q756_9RHOB|nr:calcium-binding protein [Roseivivax lentus]SIT18661.1 Hemolysin-type calcium-binding repeat-containing protein [Roseivivax lentus]